MGIHIDMQVYKSKALLALAVAIGASCWAGGELSAQARRRAKASAKPRIAASALQDSLQQQLGGYRFAEALSSLQQLEQQTPKDSLAHLANLRERIERAERMLGRVETVQLLARHECSWEELNSFFAEHTTLAKQVAFSVDSLGNYVMEQSGAIDGYRWRYSSVGQRRDITLSTRLVNGEQETELLPPSINTAEANEGFAFVLSDGLSLVFASDRADDGLGGYDLYLGRYNVDRASYLEPSLLPMPYNSPADDYALIYDEELERSYLISNRDCQAGKVAVYTLAQLPKIIAGVRADDALPELDHRQAIEIARLSAYQGLAPLEKVSQRIKEEPCYLPLNGNTIIQRWSDFTSAEAMELYREYLQDKQNIQELESSGREPQTLQQLRTKLKNKLILVKNTEILNRQKQ